jgi:hypothetical protein
MPKQGMLAGIGMGRNWKIFSEVVLKPLIVWYPAIIF